MHRSRTITRAQTRCGAICQTAQRSASRTAACSSVMLQTSSWQGGASPRRTTRTHRFGPWVSAWRWDKRWVRLPRSLWLSESHPVTSAMALRDRLRRDGAVLDVEAAVAMKLARTVLGDVRADALGVCYAHEHLVIDGGVPAIINPEISLPDDDKQSRKLRSCTDAGVRTMVDAMPADAGRKTSSSPTSAPACTSSWPPGCITLATTAPDTGASCSNRPELAELFIADIEVGVDASRLQRSRRTSNTASPASSRPPAARRPSARDRRTFEAAALTASRTGVPVLTHCEGGTGALEQIKLLDELDVPLARVVLSHTDKVADHGYHRDLLGSGACVVYDQGIRTPGQTHDWSLRWSRTASPRRSCWAPMVHDARCGQRWAAPRIAALRTDLGARLTAALGDDLVRQLWIDNPKRILALAYEGSRRQGLRRYRSERHGSRCRAPIRCRGRRRHRSVEGRGAGVALDLPYITVDLADEAATTAAFAQVCAQHGRIDATYAVAGASGRKIGDGPVHEMSLAAWQGTFDLNAVPSFLTAREAVRA